MIVLRTDLLPRLLVVWLILCSVASITEAAPRTGSVEFQPAAGEAKLPERFRLAHESFAFEQTKLDTSSTQFELSAVTFPSPVTTPEPNNNTVHCEYYRPLTPGRHPAVVVLHIMGGDFPLSRLFCRVLASQGVAALFVKMPYYGPRRQLDSPARMVSLDPRQTVRGMTQAVLDVRRAAAWLASQEEVDPQQLGIMGISLGGITAALAATAEPRFQRVCLILAGGDIHQVAWDSKELAPLRDRWTSQGGTKESLYELLAQVDPATYGDNVRGRKILMLNARHDEIIPRACTESLWRSFGRPEIVWWDAGHISAGRFLFEGLARTATFFKATAN